MKWRYWWAALLTPLLVACVSSISATPTAVVTPTASDVISPTATATDITLPTPAVVLTFKPTSSLTRVVDPSVQNFVSQLNDLCVQTRLKSSPYAGCIGGYYVYIAGSGHPAAIGSISVVIASGPSAGQFKSRYWAIALSSMPVILIAMLAVPVIAVIQALPIAYTLTIGALALLVPFRQRFAITRTGDLRIGALAAFGLAALPLQALGMPVAFWALIAGIAISAIAERSHLMAIWRPSPAGHVV